MRLCASALGCSLLLAVTALPGIAVGFHAQQQQPETLSLLGRDLYPPPIPAGERRDREEALLSARAAYGKDRANVDSILALARADLGMGHVGDAVEILTRGLEAVPDDPRLDLERGRDLIVMRKFDHAQRDLRKAIGKEPEAECALGLALYLGADFPRAQASFATCEHPGIFGYVSALRAGTAKPARPEVEEEPADSSTSVLRLPGSVLSRSAAHRAPMSANYMDAMERLMAGKKDRARDLLKEIVEKHVDRWMEPVYIAAEVDYSKLRKPVIVPRKG